MVKKLITALIATAMLLPMTFNSYAIDENCLSTEEISVNDNEDSYTMLSALGLLCVSKKKH